VGKKEYREGQKPTMAKHKINENMLDSFRRTGGSQEVIEKPNQPGRVKFRKNNLGGARSRLTQEQTSKKGL